MTTTDYTLAVGHHIPKNMCSQCSSMAHFQCMEHCKNVFCGKCSVKHRSQVTHQMDELREQLKRCKIDPTSTQDEIDANFERASKQTIQRTHDTVNNLIAEIQQRESQIIKEIENGLKIRQKDRELRTNSALLTSEEAFDYTHLLNDCLKQDQLVNNETMVNIQRRLDARNALGRSASEAKSPLVELGKFEPNKLLHLRFAPRAQSALSRTKTKNIVHVTVRLDKHKSFQTPMQTSFSIGKHPTAISLNDRYLETFFCRRTPGNSLLLLSSTAVDIITRGSGVESSVRLTKILGPIKDKILAGCWCEYSQRLVLIGNHRMYFYDLQGQEHAKIFPCEPTQGDPGNTARFLGCTYDGSIFYAYKSERNSYTIQKHSHPNLAKSKIDHANHESAKQFFQPKIISTINGRIAGMCVAHNSIVIVYRQFETEKKFEHFICVLDHNLKRLQNNDVQLPSDIKWITAITSFGVDGQYLLCDPRGQQLLLYRIIDGILIRRFRIGAINACCLTDGKLVLWLQKQYASSPTGKLHFITAPHLEESVNVAKSFALLNKI